MEGNFAYTAELVESYVDNLELLELMDNKIYKLAGTVKAKGPEHFWLKDSVRSSKAPAAAAKGEGRQFVGQAGSDTVRIYNTTQFFMEDVQVTGTVQRSDHLAVADRFAHEVMKQEKAVAKDIERAMIYGVRDQGTFTTEETAVRQMGGVKELITDNAATNYFDGAATLDEDLLTSYVQATWTYGDRQKALDVFTSPAQKNAITLFTTPNQRNIEAKAKMIVLPVDTIATDFGEVNIHLHREMAAGDMLGLDTSTIYKASLLAPTTERYGKRGDSEDGAVKAELTVELRRPENSFFVTDLTTGTTS